MSDIPLAVLDLVPISSGSTAAEALRNSIDLARRAERFGYARYWFAEHHLNPGVAGTSPAVVLALTAAATTHDPARLRRRAARAPHRAVHRRGVRADRRAAPGPVRPRARPLRRAPAGRAGRAARRPAHARSSTAAPRTGCASRRGSPSSTCCGSPRFALQRKLLQQPGAESQDYAEQIDDILALLAGTYRSAGRRRGARRARARAPTCRCGSWAAAAGRAPQVAGAQRPAVRGELPRQPGHRAGGGGGLPGGVPALRRARPALRQRLRRRRRRRGRGDRPRAGHRLRAVGAQHPHRRGRDPVPDARARPARHAWTDEDRALVAGPGRHPVRRLAAARSPTSWRRCATPPAPTSCSSPPSPTTTPTGCAPTSCWPRSGNAGDAAPPTGAGRCHSGRSSGSALVKQTLNGLRSYGAYGRTRCQPSRA